MWLNRILGVTAMGPKTLCWCVADVCKHYSKGLSRRAGERGERYISFALITYSLDISRHTRPFHVQLLSPAGEVEHPAVHLCLLFCSVKTTVAEPISFLVQAKKTAPFQAWLVLFGRWHDCLWGCRPTWCTKWNRERPIPIHFVRKGLHNSCCASDNSEYWSEFSLN